MSKRKHQVRRITLPHPPRRSKAGGSMPSICIACGEPIDLDAVMTAIAAGHFYMHPCGRQLYTYKIDHRAEAEATAEIEGYGPR